MKINNRPYFLDNTMPRHNKGKLAIIDIGSSMVRLVIYDEFTGKPDLLINKKVWIALGEGKKCSSFSLAEEKITKTITVLKEFLETSSQNNCKSVLAIATSAVREATNGKQFTKRVFTEIGLHIEIISEETEARLASFGAIASVPNASGLVMDLGGGSLELCETDNKKRIVSMPKGVLSLSAESNNNPAKAIDIIKNEIKKYDWLQTQNYTSLIALGSGMRTIAGLYMIKTNSEVQNFNELEIEKNEAIKFCKDLMENQIYNSMPDMTTEWKEVLPFRAASLCGVLETINLKNVRFADYGIREGLFLSQLSNK